MVTILFRRESVCMGDDVRNGEYTIKLQDSATLGELLSVILYGGSGNDWPIPYTGANSRWVIQSDIGNLARIFTDSNGKWHITDYCCNEQTLLKELKITRTYGWRTRE